MYARFSRFVPSPEGGSQPAWSFTLRLSWRRPGCRVGLSPATPPQLRAVNKIFRNTTLIPRNLIPRQERQLQGTSILKINFDRGQPPIKKPFHRQLPRVIPHHAA